MNSELMCLTCGAVVRDAKLHSAWHVAEARGETEVPLPTASQPEAPMTWWEKEQKETLQKFHEYASRNGAIPGDDVFLFALCDAEAYRSSKQEMTCRCCHASTRDFNPYPCCGHCGAMLVPDAGPKPESLQNFIDTPFGKIVIDARVPPGEIRLHDWNGPTMVRNIKVDPEVPHPPDASAVIADFEAAVQRHVIDPLVQKEIARLYGNPVPPASAGECAGADVLNEAQWAYIDATRSNGHTACDCCSVGMRAALQVAFSAIRVSAGLVAIEVQDPHCWARNMQAVLDIAARRIGLQPDNKAVDAQENEGRN